MLRLLSALLFLFVSSSSASAPPVLTIPVIQGSGVLSPVDGDDVTTTGVVVGDFQGADELDGFFLQDPQGDSNDSTSDGIFVFDPAGTDVAVGDNVTVTGTVGTFNDNTQLESITALSINSSGNVVAPTVITMPESVDGELEQYEGMLVQINQTMTISQLFFLPRFGQMVLSSPDDSGMPGRLFEPTNQFAAGTQPAVDLADENARRILILDDGQDVNVFGDNPDPVPYLGGPPPSVLRSGDTLAGLTGVLDQGSIIGATPTEYRLHPTVAPVFSSVNPRTNAPKPAGGGFKIASFNVLNYFNTLDTGASICGPAGDRGCRGADTAAEFTRQRDKIFSALIAMDADIVGLMELENDGVGAGSSIQDLVDGLNAAIGSDKYSVLAVDEGAAPGIGGDTIAVGFIYQHGTVTPIGTPATLETGAFTPGLLGTNRVPIAASFEHKRSREQITVAANHFKSKGGAPNPPLNNGNDDQGDGQGPWNLRRTDAANDLSDWLATFPTGITDPDILIIGDINAYSLEDPLLAFANKGYENLVKTFEGDDSYSFTFSGTSGSLDHALSTASLTPKVASVETWHINVDEPPVLDYNSEFKPSTYPADYYQPDAFRSSDHDPVIVTLVSDEFCWAITTDEQKVMTVCL